MSDLIGHSVGIVVVFVVGMFVFSSTRGAEEAAVSGAQYRAGKKALLTVAAVLEQDLRNLGSNFPNYYSFEPDSAVLSWDTASAVRHLEFVAQTQPGLMPDTVRYEWKVVDSIEIDGSVKPILELTRMVNGVRAGWSTAHLSRVKVVLKRVDGLPISALAETRQVEIELEGFSSLGIDRTVKLTRWNGSYRPIAVTRDDFGAD